MARSFIFPSHEKSKRNCKYPHLGGRRFKSDRSEQKLCSASLRGKESPRDHKTANQRRCRSEQHRPKSLDTLNVVLFPKPHRKRKIINQGRCRSQHRRSLKQLSLTARSLESEGKRCETANRVRCKFESAREGEPNTLNVVTK
jgi:hypothetical protein